MPKFLYNADGNDDANAIAIPQVFSENSRARNMSKEQKVSKNLLWRLLNND